MQDFLSWLASIHEGDYEQCDAIRKSKGLITLLPAIRDVLRYQVEWIAKNL